MTLIQIFTVNNLTFLRIGRVFSSMHLFHVNWIFFLIFQNPQSSEGKWKCPILKKKRKKQKETDFKGKQINNEVVMSTFKITLGKVYVLKSSDLLSLRNRSYGPTDNCKSISAMLITLGFWKPNHQVSLTRNVLSNLKLQQQLKFKNHRKKGWNTE